MNLSWMIAVLALAPACVLDSEYEPARACWPDQPVTVDPAGVAYPYAVDTVTLPNTADKAEFFGLDLDCAPGRRPDNALGQVLSTIASQDPDGYDLDREAKLLVDAGQMVHLIQIQATDLDRADGVGVVVLHGADPDGDGDASANFAGIEPFAIDETRGRGLLTGRIDDGVLTAEYGTAPIAIAFPGLDEPFVLPLIGARIEARRTDTGFEGAIGGAVPEELIDSLLLPVFEDGLNRVVARDCVQVTCAPDSFGALLLELFDDDPDGVITTDELRDNSLVSALLAPDVDLRDEDGAFAPGRDGVNDALSIGMGFTAVPVRFAPQ